MARNYIVIDTEGVDTQKRTDGQPNPSSGLFYDMGYLVIDGETGEVLQRRSFINSDVFFNLSLTTQQSARNTFRVWGLSGKSQAPSRSTAH